MSDEEGLSYLRTRVVLQWAHGRATCSFLFLRALSRKQENRRDVRKTLSLTRYKQVNYQKGVEEGNRRENKRLVPSLLLAGETAGLFFHLPVSARGITMSRLVKAKQKFSSHLLLSKSHENRGPNGRGAAE